MSEVQIAVDSEICGGKPVIRGTRVPLEFVVKTLKRGLSAERIHEEYPTVSTEVVKEISDALRRGREVAAKLAIA